MAASPNCGAKLPRSGTSVHALWNAHMNPHLILHRRINLMLQLNCQLENMITEYKDDFAFPPGPAEDFENTCTTMLQLQAQVAEHFLEEGIAYFDVTSKCHMLQELAILARHINPRLIWVFCGEDMMQKMQQVAQSCTKNGPPLPPRIAFLVQETSRMKALLSVFLTPQSTLRSRTVCAKKGAPSSCLSCNRQDNTRSPPKGSSQILFAEDLRGFFRGSP